MKSKITLSLIAALILAVSACKGAKPSGSSNSNSASANANKASANLGKSVPAAKTVPVPANWDTMADEEKGYGFQLPAGSQTHNENHDGVDVFAASTPEPSKVALFVMAFKNRSLSKDDLLKFASGFLEGLNEKDIKIGMAVELSGDYSLATISSTDENGKVTKGKVLVATDVSDNYVMILGTPEADFAENEKIIDAIWGSFTMRSGGSTGKS